MTAVAVGSFIRVCVDETELDDVSNPAGEMTVESLTAVLGRE